MHICTWSHRPWFTLTAYIALSMPAYISNADTPICLHSAPAKAGLGKPRLKSAQSGPVKYREVTCPIGAVNPHTALVPFREAYPVPECYVTVGDRGVWGRGLLQSRRQENIASQTWSVGLSIECSKWGWLPKQPQWM
jgi:hypothetical protein